jgi:uncharacterized protein
MRRVEIAVGTVVVAVVLLVPLLHASGALQAICYVGLLVLGLAGEYIAGRRYRSWGYCERSRDLLVRRGVLVRRLTIVPYGRMQLVDVTAGAAERVFGLATIKLHTAASTTDARIPGLPPDEATRLRDQLAALGEAQAAGV